MSSRVLASFALVVCLLPAASVRAQQDPQCSPMTGTRLRLRKLDLDLGQQRILYRGTMTIPADAVLDPAATGMRFLVADDAGTVMVDVTVPPGARTTGGAAGWFGTSQSIAWSYADHGASGIRTVQLRRRTDDTLRVVIYGHELSFAPPVRHVYVHVYFTDQSGAVVCGRRFFHELECSYRNEGGKLNCY